MMMKLVRYEAIRASMQCAIGCLLMLCALVAQAQSAPAPSAATSPKTVLVMGDSLSAGYGMAADQGWVGLLEQRLQREAPGWRVVNGSISGETSAGAGDSDSRQSAQRWSRSSSVSLPQSAQATSGG